MYTIVLIESSPTEFHRIPNHYIHRSSQKFDTGLKLDLLQEYIFVALDIFLEIHHNIDKELDAWMYFLSSDRPLDIGRVIEAYPAFRELYREIAEFQRKPEELISMYNETLAMLDRNTVYLMIEEQQAQLAKKDEELNYHKEEISQNKEEIMQQKEVIVKKDEEIELLRQQLAALSKE